ncbi:MAG: VOC family protein [Pseudooceanicola sp.]|nr:VOC family protein [Pseudooceanicola sp.]
MAEGPPRLEPRVSLITLGARDIPRLAAFYEALGWARVPNPHGVVAFDLIGQTLALYELEDLARDLGIDSAALGHGAMTLAHNVRTRDEVAPLMARAEAAGARILRPAGEIFWGGVIGYFADPEGHIWEIAWNPGAPLSHTGEFRWNGYP